MKTDDRLKRMETQLATLVAGKRLEVARLKSKARDHSIEIRNERGEHVKTIHQLTYAEAFRYQRDLYKILVTAMNQKISMRIRRKTA